MSGLHEEQPCPVCSGVCNVMGELGSRIHYRCRACGMDHSVSTKVPTTQPAEAQRLIADAAQAATLFCEDELERHVARKRK